MKIVSTVNGVLIAKIVKIAEIVLNVHHVQIVLIAKSVHMLISHIIAKVYIIHVL